MVNTSSTATPLQVPNTVPCQNAGPCQAQEAEIARLRREVARLSGALARAEAELDRHHQITANKTWTPQHKQCAHMVAEWRDHRTPARPNDPQHLALYPIADEAARYGMSASSLGDNLKKLAAVGFIGRKEESTRVAGMKRTHVFVGAGELYDKPEQVVNLDERPGGKRVKCVECGSENLDIITSGRCRDCGTVFQIGSRHQHDGADTDDDEMNDEYRALLNSTGKPEASGAAAFFAELDQPLTEEDRKRGGLPSAEIGESEARNDAPVVPSESESWSNEPADVAAQFGMEWQPGEIAESDPGSIFDEMHVGTMMGRCDKSPHGFHEAGMATRRPSGPKLCVWCGAEMDARVEVFA